MRSNFEPQSAAKEHVRKIRQQTRNRAVAEEKVRIVLGQMVRWSFAPLLMIVTLATTRHP
jgi:hypothetical protein